MLSANRDKFPSVKQYTFGQQKLALFHHLITGSHQHPSMQLSLSLHETPLMLETDDGQQSAYGFLIPSNLRHKLSASEQCCINLFIDPADPYYFLLAHRLPTTQRALFLDRSLSHRLAITLLANIQRTEPADIPYLSTLLGGTKECACRQDKRIVKAATLIAALHSKRISSHEISSQIYLSESRFLHLFRAEMGINFRRYLLWQRLQKAVNDMSPQISLTNLARDSGFADSAHFSRTCMMSYGLRPSTLKQATTQPSFHPLQGCRQCLTLLGG